MGERNQTFWTSAATVLPISRLLACSPVADLRSQMARPTGEVRPQAHHTSPIPRPLPASSTCHSLRSVLDRRTDIYTPSRPPNAPLCHSFPPSSPSEGWRRNPAHRAPLALSPSPGHHAPRARRLTR
ncbi:hypothetical protein GY45DRAFT_24604 [Cubamyces sp. BRFM 1775]|nr:hypothetical protein GY45DRAFT_24604 [Cubamyces sp. BRFM 1775]